MAGKPKLEDLNPRISLSMGMTLPTGQQYKMVRAEAGLTIDRPMNMTVEETYTWLEGELLEHLSHALNALDEAIE